MTMTKEMLMKADNVMLVSFFLRHLLYPHLCCVTFVGSDSLVWVIDGTIRKDSRIVLVMVLLNGNLFKLVIRNN